MTRDRPVTFPTSETSSPPPAPALRAPLRYRHPHRLDEREPADALELDVAADESHGQRRLHRSVTAPLTHFFNLFSDKST